MVLHCKVPGYTGFHNSVVYRKGRNNYRCCTAPDYNTHLAAYGRMVDHHMVDYRSAFRHDDLCHQYFRSIFVEDSKRR